MQPGVPDNRNSLQELLWPESGRILRFRSVNGFWRRRWKSEAALQNSSTLSGFWLGGVFLILLVVGLRFGGAFCSVCLDIGMAELSRGGGGILRAERSTEYGIVLR